MLFAADSTGAIGSALSSMSSGLRIPDFPCEEPSEKELTDFLQEAMPMLKRAGYAPILRRECPPTLLHLKGAEMVPAALTTEELTTAGPVESAKHERLCQKLIRSNTQRELQLTECMRGIRTQLHAMVEISMRVRAPLRLAELEHANPEKDAKGDPIPGVHDGVGMLADLCKLAGTVGLLDDPRDHDREVEKMRDTQLPDGCAAQDYSDKVNRLVQDHLNFLERPLTGDNLGKFLIRLIPAANAAEGRTILRDLTASKELSNRVVVVQRCTQVVRLSESPVAKAAAAAAAVQRRQLMALGPAAPMTAAMQIAVQAATAARAPHRPLHGPPAGGTEAAAPKPSKSARRAAKSVAAAAAATTTAAAAATTPLPAELSPAHHVLNACLKVCSARTVFVSMIILLDAIARRTARSSRRTWKPTPRW